MHSQHTGDASVSVQQSNEGPCIEIDEKSCHLPGSFSKDVGKWHNMYWPFFIFLLSVNILTRLLNADTTFDKKKEKRKRNSADPLASL